MSMLTPRGVGGYHDVRRRASARRAVTAALLVLLVVAASVLAWRSQDSTGTPAAARGTARPTPTCSTPAPTPTVAAADIRVNVYNATGRRGLAGQVAAELRSRGFRIGRVDNDPLHHPVLGVAEVRNGPAGDAAARTVAAQLPSYVEVPDQRPGPAVDVVVGREYQHLRSPAAAADALASTPSPSPGC